MAKEAGLLASLQARELGVPLTARVQQLAKSPRFKRVMMSDDAIPPGARHAIFLGFDATGSYLISYAWSSMRAAGMGLRMRIDRGAGAAGAADGGYESDDDLGYGLQRSLYMQYWHVDPLCQAPIELHFETKLDIDNNQIIHAADDYEPHVTYVECVESAVAVFRVWHCGAERLKFTPRPSQAVSVASCVDLLFTGMDVRRIRVVSSFYPVRTGRSEFSLLALRCPGGDCVECMVVNVHGDVELPPEYTLTPEDEPTWYVYNTEGVSSTTPKGLGDVNLALHARLNVEMLVLQAAEEDGFTVLEYKTSVAGFVSEEATILIAVLSDERCVHAGPVIAEKRQMTRIFDIQIDERWAVNLQMAFLTNSGAVPREIARRSIVWDECAKDCGITYLNETLYVLDDIPYHTGVSRMITYNDNALQSIQLSGAA